jgi:hypothetical protein
VTRDEFLRLWLAESGLRYLPSDRYVERCGCREAGCNGWAMAWTD